MLLSNQQKNLKMKPSFQKWIKSAAVLACSALILAAPGCSKEYLDVDPQATQASATFYTSADDAAKLVNGMYATLRSWQNVAFAPMAVESVGSDDTEKGSSVNDATFMNDFDNFTVAAGQGQLQDFWIGQYGNILLANTIIEKVPGINMDANLRNRYVAEAKFVRAYSYFRLVRAFGDVPLQKKVASETEDYNLPRSPKAEVYAFIETDLKDAAAVLPASYSNNDLGRATKGSALGILAKVCMYQKKWADVLNYTNQVMALGYTLFPNYESQFRVANEMNSESVFEIQAALIPGNSGASNSQYSQIQGVRGSVGGGWGFNVPTADLAASYEAGDPRRDATIIFRGETTPAGDAIPATGDNQRYNQKSYVPFSQYVTGFNEGAQQNIRVMRYAEVLLMNAEAANETGDGGKARASLELVRARARGGNTTILPPVTTTDQAALRTAIWNERRSELAMEYDRYFDVIRQGRAAVVFGPKGWKANKNEVWPIPQNEIDKSAGVLTQNPGY